MRYLLAIALLNATLSVLGPHGSTAAAYNDDTAPQLQLSTKVVRQQYSSEGGKLLRLKLDLTFSNTGHRPLLLDKKSTLVYRTLLSDNLKAASQGRYTYDESSSFISPASLKVAGIRDSLPDRQAFILIKPRESYSVERDLLIRLYDGTTNTRDFAHPGNHLLQVSVATWYYLADPATYRSEWVNDGYLWSSNVTSLAMPLRIENGR